MIQKDKPAIILEAMKTEITVTTAAAGKIQDVIVKKGQLVNQGDLLCVLEKEELKH